ncbi:MAG TPA: FecR domain-containing protein [Membranihabitans sp.]|nr:FecR domain-containing protein [Membranihabitans sp.]
MQQIKELLQKHLRRTLTTKEADDLFDQMKNLKSAEEVDEVMKSRWGLSTKNRLGSDLTWSHIVEEKNRRIGQSQFPISSFPIRQSWKWGIAASFALVVSLGLWWMWSSGSDYVTYTTAYGETRNIVLNDGSKVILNANSSLTWKTDWKTDSIRFAKLQGEAFFDVARVELSSADATISNVGGERMPFQVKTPDLVIDVLGTMFNVADRRGETQVHLEEGSIKLELLDSRHEVREGSDLNTSRKKMIQPVAVNTILMLPGETVEYSAKSMKLEKLNSEKSESLTEWREGTLAYHDVDFGQMLDHLEDIYGKHFVVRDSTLFDTKVSIGLPFEDWKTVRSLMELFLQIELTTSKDDQVIIDKR